ncbi:sugar transferase [Flavobacterium sp. 245]|uniref:sugar transferase n=1 Tax=Flavobacterium sp. 245 TaxID=2512115 RepID=UPI001060534F|nr:sugar transferase [Flavobacterium sp. 245]TDP00901.1 lipopolysaccharide/colanic/teichoic acid biosynthesis glycosyltransferase [Flavobacterium sp. 245]
MYKFFLKRPLDFIISIVCICLLMPIFIIVFVGLYLANDGKPFFFQSRPGLNEKVFKIIKFKTMNDKKDEAGNLLPDAERLTKIGSYVRKTSLDEIPQLFNVLRGEMSLIGPRPLLPEYLPLYNDFQKQRHNIRPGITGWAQVNGRNTISWEEKFKFDVYYANNISFLLDLKIVFLTVEKVFKSEGINAENVATTESFKGN